MNKASSGKALSPAEQEQLRGYFMQRAQQAAPGMGRPASAQAGGAPRAGAAAAVAPGGMGRLFAEARNAVPHPRPGLVLAKRKALDATGYAQLLAQVVAETRTALGNERAGKIDGALRKDPRLGPGLGVLLTFSPDGTAAAAYALAQTALQHPADAQLASNLGVLLYNANHFERAYDVLGYAEALAPGSPTVLSNRGYAALYLGDFAAAKALFGRATAGGLKVPEAHVGLSLLARASGSGAQAAEEAQVAIAQGSGSLVAAVEDGTARASRSREQRADDTPLADRAPSQGGVVYDLGAASGFSWPVWTIPSDPALAVASAPNYVPWWGQATKKLGVLAQRRKAAEERYVAAQQAKGQQPPSGVTFPRSNHRLSVILGDLEDIYDARLDRSARRWEKEQESFKKEAAAAAASLRSGWMGDERGCARPAPLDMDRACEEAAFRRYCKKLDAQAKMLHASIGSAYAKNVTEAGGLITEFWKKSEPYAEGIADPLLSESTQLEREFLAEKYLLAFRGGVVATWLPTLDTFLADHCNPPPPPPAKNGKDDAETPKAKTGDCHPPPGRFGLGPVSTSWDCNSFTIQGGEGLFAGVTVRTPGAGGNDTKTGHTETTVFAGFGAEVAAGSLKGEAKAVISFTQSQGQVVDVGAGYSTSAGASGFGSKAEAGTDLTWSMRAGPNFSGAASASWTGHELGSAKF